MSSIGQTDWCPECHTYRIVVDDHYESTMESGYMSRSTTEREVHVIDLKCGHSKAWDTGKSTTYRDWQ